MNRSPSPKETKPIEVSQDMSVILRVMIEGREKDRLDTWFLFPTDFLRGQLRIKSRKDASDRLRKAGNDLFALSVYDGNESSDSSGQILSYFSFDEEEDCVTFKLSESLRFNLIEDIVVVSNQSRKILNRILLN